MVDPIVVGDARTLLVGVARRRGTITYGEVCRQLGYGMPNGLGPLLDELSDDCTARDEPSLAALVVNAQTGRAGYGYRPGGGRWEDQLAEVQEFWADAAV